MIKLVNKLVDKLKNEDGKSKRKNMDLLQHNAKAANKEEIQSDNKTFSKFKDLPDALVRSLVDSLPLDNTFFWKYGTINRRMLCYVEELMQRKKLLVNFMSIEKEYKARIKFLKSSSRIAKSIEKIGMTIINNDKKKEEEMKITAKRCPNLRIIAFYKSDVSLEMMKWITKNCSDITHLGLGKCKYINKKMIEMISENCKYLEHIAFPQCSSLNLMHSSTKKTRKNGDIIGPSLFGVAIESYELVHDSNKCNDSGLNRYSIGSAFAITEIEGKKLTSVIKILYLRPY